MIFLAVFVVLALTIGFWPAVIVAAIYVGVDIAFMEHQKREAWRRA